MYTGVVLSAHFAVLYSSRLTNRTILHSC